MNKYTDDQSTPVGNAYEDNNRHHTSFFPATSDLRNENQGALRVEANECKVETSLPVKQYWKKPSDMPKRPMSSYNLFYRMERDRLVEGREPRLYTIEDINLFIVEQKRKDERPKEKRKHRKTHGMISFTDLARVIACNWKKLDEAAKIPFRDRAVIEKQAYTAEIVAWNKTKSTVEGGTKRKADASIVPKSNKSQTEETNDAMYESYDRNETLIDSFHDDAIANIRRFGKTEGLQNDPTSTETYDSVMSHNLHMEQFAFERIYPAKSMGSNHHQDDLFSTAGTLNRSRSLSDITDFEQLSAANQTSTTTGQPNYSFQDHRPISRAFGTSAEDAQIDSDEQKPAATITRSTFTDGRRPVASNIEGLPQGVTSDIARSNPMLASTADVRVNPMLAPAAAARALRMIDYSLSNRFTSQPVLSSTDVPEQLPQYVSGQFNNPNIEQEYFQNNDSAILQRVQDFPSSIRQWEGTDQLHAHSTNLSYPRQRIQPSNFLHMNNLGMLPITANQSMATTHTLYNSQFLHDTHIVLNEPFGIPRHQLLSYPARQADFVTTLYDAQLGYAVPQNLVHASTQTPHQSTYMLPLQYLHHPSNNHIVDAQHPTYRVPQPYYNETTIPYLQQPNDNNVVFQSGAMYHPAQQYVPIRNNVNDNHIMNYNIATAQQASGSIQPEQQQSEQQHHQQRDDGYDDAQSE